VKDENANGEKMMTTAIANENLTGTETSTIHRFERAGLGKAPFVFTGMTEKVHCVPGGTPVAGSSCDFCGTGIRYEFWCRSADSREFKVGCDCIHKIGDRGLIQQISVAERKLRDAKNIAAKARRVAKNIAAKARKAERLAVRMEAAKAILPTVRGRLAEQPHPSPYFAGEGRTLLDYVNWCFENWAAEKACVTIELAAK
jgi:hypothetical protein